MAITSTTPAKNFPTTLNSLKYLKKYYTKNSIIHQNKIDFPWKPLYDETVNNYYMKANKNGD